MSEKVTGVINIECYVSCPKCDEQIDLFEQEQLTDDGYLSRKIFGIIFGCFIMGIHTYTNTEDAKKRICSDCGRRFDGYLKEK